MNTNKIIYWVATTIMCLVFAFSAIMYITKYDMVTEMFPVFGFPSWLVAPLATAKILGIIAALSNKSKLLTEWAYAGFFFDASLAFATHYIADDGSAMGSIIALVATVVSRIMLKFRMY